jgi:hypothetical protein
MTKTEEIHKMVTRKMLARPMAPASHLRPPLASNKSSPDRSVDSSRSRIGFYGENKTFEPYIPYICTYIPTYIKTVDLVHCIFSTSSTLTMHFKLKTINQKNASQSHTLLY